MKTYNKNGATFQVFCNCDEPSGDFTDYPNEGKWDAMCPVCHYYYHYYPSNPLVEDLSSVNDTVEEDCEEEELMECEECGESCTETFTTEDGEVCSECFSNYSKCTDCGEWVKDTCNTNNGPVCQNCYDETYFTCERCGSVHSSEDSNTVVVNTYGREEEYWCDSCVGQEAYRCDDCGDVFHPDCTSSDGNSTYCHCCMDLGSRKGRRIHDYNFNPSASMHGKGPLYLGVELEMECSDRSDTADSLYALSDEEDLFYIKSDGSLKNGIEVVTHPCSLAFHQEEFGWEDLVKAAVSEGARSHDTSTCGIHVHLSRKFFTLSEVTRFVAFVNVHGDHLKVLARREASGYSRFKNKNSGTKRLVTQEERYEAVNLYNSRTLEVRIFKGTLKKSTLMSCIEVCDAMARFIKTSNIASIVGKSEENWEQFLSFVNNNLDMYSNLHEYMIKKGLVKVVALPPAPLVDLASLPDEIVLPWEELYGQDLAA